MYVILEPQLSSKLGGYHKNNVKGQQKALGIGEGVPIIFLKKKLKCTNHLLLP